MKKWLLSATTVGLLSACSTQTVPTDTFLFEGRDSYQLVAADVFRLRKAYPEYNLTKSLRPLYKNRYYSEPDFKAALSESLKLPLNDELYVELKRNALVDAQKVQLKVLSDKAVQVKFGHSDSIELSEMLDTSAFQLPVNISADGNKIATGEMEVIVAENTLCVSVSTAQGALINKICPESNNTFSLSTDVKYQYSGLGQEFQNPGVIDGTWNGKVRHSGNRMEGFNHGATGNTMFPVLYATNTSATDFAIYLDNKYSTEWDFTKSDAHINSVKGDSNLIVMLADEQAELREKYMQLTGKPLVPPRKMFGLWLSEYGFDNWQEMDDKLNTLKSQNFPIDGVVMDLQWFGNVQGGDPNSQMGTLTWDKKNFPEPEQKIANLKKDGIGMMLIEESYVSSGLEEHRELEKRGYLAKDPETGKAINTNPSGGGNWWGKGGMIDWSNPEVGEFWHEWKRKPLVEMGVIGHWTDLGEPEMYNPKSVYFNDQPHNEIHNVFNYRWLESIYEGYQRNETATRPFMMSRSGTTGIQKFGASMWSADIGSNLSSLATHAGQQTNMMLSGIDYYGSDIGGFHRKGLVAIGERKKVVLKETYTQWFAYSSMFDVPVRPHTENLCNCKETAPDRVGDLLSNRANIELRYQMIPYLYSLAHVAHLEGKPLFPSLAYTYPKDDRALAQHHQKMIGSSLMSVAVAQLGQTTTEAYFPEGNWFDFRTGEKLNLSETRHAKDLPLYQDGLFELPLFAVEGAIIPFNPETTGNMSSDVPDTLAVKVFGLAESNEFTLYEDDGATNRYLDGEVRKTRFETNHSGSKANMTLSTHGSYQNAKDKRDLLIDWFIGDREVEEVLLDGVELSSWEQLDGKISISVADLNLLKSHRFTLKLKE
ncbi:TIM-barrel domain-containing protein [Vibrio sp. HN007]|uniref:TIM-barrel domain-containing protein n=1 Tax=Vibrio iocasae TaxID=3098914 RepID=UPI0035D44DAA